MIQILALREFYSEKHKKNIKSEVWFERGIRAANVEEIFSEPDRILETLEASERVNVYYTVADCLEEKGRKLLIQNHIPFDVDGIDVPDVDTDAHLATLAEIVCSAIGVPFNQVGILFSGNGLQFLVGTTVPIEDVDYFDRNRAHYGAICDRIDLKLQQARLDGKSDRSVWSPARLMRMPKTWNEKPNKPRRISRILQSEIVRTEFDVTKASHLPEVAPEDAVSESVVRSFPTPDVKTILSECKFLANAQANPEKVSEPEWYAMLSVTARFPEGRNFSHKMSQGHPGYSFEETEIKIDQALSATTGPRTCKNIDAVSGGKCAGCKHRGTMLVSPILIKGPDHIETEHTGFRLVIQDKNGKPKLGRADISGLRKYLVREEKAIAIREAGTVWTFNGKFFEPMSRMEVQRYAQRKIQPEPSIHEKSEFFDSVQKMDGAKPADFFNDSTRGRVNFQNGVLDVRTGSFVPHSQEFGFRSVLACDYAKDAQAPRFTRFIDEVTLGRHELGMILQEFMGYVFANEDCRYQKAIMLVGDGENGKSVLVDVIRKIAGKEGASNIPVTDFNDPQAVKLLEGKMVNLAEENSMDAFRHSGVVKNMIRGGEMRVKVPYEQTYEIQNNTKLIMLVNRMPRLDDHSHGFFRSFIFIPFDAMFSFEAGNRDVNLTKTLEKEQAGIINWAMEGYKRLTENGSFSSSKVATALLEDYKKEANPFELFFEEMCEITQEEGEFLVPSQELWQTFDEWAKISGFKMYTNRSHLTKFLTKKIEKSIHKRLEEKRVFDDKGSRVRAIPHLKLRLLPGGVRV